MIRLPDSYFAAVYARGDDPWGFDSRFYESRKYALTLAALPRERYARAFEPGCANGALTARLADRVDTLVASEMMPEVAARARARLRGHAHVEVRVGALPEALAEGPFDLLVLSEVVYYLTDEGVTDLLSRADAALAPGAHVVAVHWTGETDYPLTGRAVHARLDAHPSWRRLVHHEDEQFVLSVHENAKR